MGFGSSSAHGLWLWTEYSRGCTTVRCEEGPGKTNLQVWRSAAGRREAPRWLQQVERAAPLSCGCFKVLC